MVCHGEFVCLEGRDAAASPLVCVMKTARGQSATVGIKALDVVSICALVGSRMSQISVLPRRNTRCDMCQILMKECRKGRGNMLRDSLSLCVCVFQ